MPQENGPPRDNLLDFLSVLSRRRVPHHIASYREGAIMVTVATPGERWEVEFLGDGSVEVERFVSDGHIAGEEALAPLLATLLDMPGGGG